MNGEYQGRGEQIGFFSECHYGSEEEYLRQRAEEIVKQITNDPIEHSIAELMIENYTEEEIAEILKISLARVEWFMRKIEAWKRNKQGDEKDS